MVSKFGKNKQVVVSYDTTTRLTILTAYKDSTNLDECFDLGAWNIDKKNNNVAYPHKHPFKWHCRIGHPGFQNIQSIPRNNC